MICRAVGFRMGSKQHDQRPPGAVCRDVAIATRLLPQGLKRRLGQWPESASIFRRTFARMLKTTFKKFQRTNRSYGNNMDAI